MKQLRPIARVVIIHDDQIMLVRNRNANFWYPPGGGWEFEGESLPECAKREVKEETNYDVTIDRMLWLSEFREKDMVYLESFWLGTLNSNSHEAHRQHSDSDPNGAVAEVRWFSEEELVDLTVFPASLKRFSEINLADPDPYLA
jgi:putative NUDIX hydrolase